MNLKSWIFAVGIGATLGAGVALLFAPQSGVVARKRIKRGAEDAADYLEDTAEYLKEQAERLANEAEGVVKRARSAADDAIEQASASVTDALKSAQKLV